MIEVDGNHPPFTVAALPSPPNPDPFPHSITKQDDTHFLVEIEAEFPKGTEFEFRVGDDDGDSRVVKIKSAG